MVIGVQCYETAPYNLGPTLPTIKLGHLVTSLEETYQITCSLLWSHKRLSTTIFLYAAVFTKTCKHTFMCKDLWSYPLRIAH